MASVGSFVPPHAPTLRSKGGTIHSCSSLARPGTVTQGKRTGAFCSEAHTRLRKTWKGTALTSFSKHLKIFIQQEDKRGKPTAVTLVLQSLCDHYALFWKSGDAAARGVVH